MENLTYEQILGLFEQTNKQFAEERAQFAEIRAQFAEIRAQFVETQVRVEKTSEQIERLSAETDKQIKALSVSSAETDKQIKALSVSSAETDKQIKALSAKMDKLSAETDKQIKTLSAETDRVVKAVSKQVAGISDAQGDFAEHQVRPKVLKLFQERGIDLNESVFDVSVRRDGKPYVQVDMLLINSIYSVVVEAKYRLRTQDVDEHATRLDLLQKYPIHSVRGTTMYGAVAGMIVSDEVARYAAKKGMFVLVPSGDIVEVANAKDFEPAVWGYAP
jgi:uncharacterized coiled-coil protein SlyX